MEIRADYSQQLLLPAAIEDWTAENHPARFIRDFVESLDLKSLGFKVRKVDRGRPEGATWTQVFTAKGVAIRTRRTGGPPDYSPA